MTDYTISRYPAALMGHAAFFTEFLLARWSFFRLFLVATIRGVRILTFSGQPCELFISFMYLFYPLMIFLDLLVELVHQVIFVTSLFAAAARAFIR